MNYPIIIQSTFPISFDCFNLCENLISTKLAGCIQKSPTISSYYHWDNQLNIDEEYQLHIKTLSNLFDLVESEILTIHPYDLPEIIATKIEFTNNEYLDWLKKSVNV